MMENGQRFTGEELSALQEPENFRGEGSKEYLPNRIVENTPRMRILGSFIDASVAEAPADSTTIAIERLRDLLVYNSFARIFPNPNSASDFIGVVDIDQLDTDRFPELVGKNLENCIVMIKTKNNQLAVVGGFNDIFEAITQTMAREAKEEAGMGTIKHPVIIDHESKTIRDERFVVISTVGSGVVQYDELTSGDDADKFVIIPLVTRDGFFNREILEPGTHTDALGNEIKHNGMRADHLFVLQKLYDYWRKYRRPQETLKETLKRVSGIVPKEWFTGYEQHPEGTDVYESVKVEPNDLLMTLNAVFADYNEFNKPIFNEQILGDSVVQTDRYFNLLLTPNIQFALKYATQILTEAGFADAQDQAKQLIFALSHRMVDILPLFPQAAVTVDCLIVKGDKLVVHKLADGIYALPGSFYSPEDPRSVYPKDRFETVVSIDQFAEYIAHQEYKLDARVGGYLGTVGGDVALGKQADERYPRLSHVVMMQAAGQYQAEAGSLPEGSTIVEIDIWEDKDKGLLSQEIRDGIENKRWAYGHGKEILPLLLRFLNKFDPERSLTAESVVIEYGFTK